MNENLRSWKHFITCVADGKNCSLGRMDKLFHGGIISIAMTHVYEGVAYKYFLYI